MILVTTAGKVGAATAESLAQHNIPVRLLARRAQPDLSPGIELVLGDLNSPASITRALDGVDTVVLVTPADPVQEIAIIDQAVDSGARHVIKITSESSTDSPIPRRRDQARIEQHLQASGLAWTLLKNNAYLQNLLMLAPQIARDHEFGSAAADGRIGMIDTRDVAAAAAAIATAPEAHAGGTYRLSGPASISYADVAAQLSTLLGYSIRYRSLTVDEQREAMIAAGMPEQLATINAAALELFALGDSDWTTSDVQTLTGRAPRSFAEFATDHLDRFAPSPA